MANVSSESIQQVLNSNGPVVSAVLLRADGQGDVVEELEIDTTPQKQMVTQVLGGPFTFLGQYEDEGIVLMIQRDPETDIAWNKHKLQPPFQNAKVQGSILAMKIAQSPAVEDDYDEEKVDHLAALSNDEFFLNYTKEEYAKFAARTDIVDMPRDENNTEEEEELYSEEEEDDESDYEGEEDEEDEEEDGFVDLLMEHVLARFQQQNGRPPEEHEMQALKAALVEKMGMPVEEEH